MLRGEPLPAWIALGVAHGDPADHPAFDVAPVLGEAWFRVDEARAGSGYEQVAAWTAWLLRENPDTLAAQVHPVLIAATRVVNVRGVGIYLAAIGDSTGSIGAPAYSALALGAGARQAEHRAQAAEALARLAASGLLDPEAYADQLATLLAERSVQAGRCAQTLADLASISAIGGYRALQTVAALLPALVEVNGAGRLIDLAARLSEDYGTPIPVPPAWEPRLKATSALGSALRAVRDVVPHPTALALDAAAEADAAHANHERGRGMQRAPSQPSAATDHPLARLSKAIRAAGRRRRGRER